MKLPLTYDNYIFDLYGTLVDIHTDESDTAIWEKLAMFYGYYGALYEAKELKERYETLVKSSEAELKKKIEKSDADAQFAISYAHEASPEIHIEDVFEKLYEEKADAESAAQEEADSQAQQTVAAAEMVAAGDKACLEKDYVGAKVYYTMAVAKYGEVADTAGQEDAQKKLDAVEEKLSEQEEQKNTAAAYESQGEACRQSGDLWGAKSQYLSAKSVYQELGSDEDVQRIEGILSDIDMQITEG